MTTVGRCSLDFSQTDIHCIPTSEVLKRPGGSEGTSERRSRNGEAAPALFGVFPDSCGARTTIDHPSQSSAKEPFRPSDHHPGQSTGRPPRQQPNPATGAEM